MSLPSQGLLPSEPRAGDQTIDLGGGGCYGAVKRAAKKTTVQLHKLSDSPPSPVSPSYHMPSGSSHKSYLPQDGRRRQREMEEQFLLATMRLEATMDDMVRLNDKIAMVQDDNKYLRQQLNVNNRISSNSSRNTHSTRSYSPRVRGTARRPGGVDNHQATPKKQSSTRPFVKGEGAKSLWRGVTRILHNAATLCSNEAELSDNDEEKTKS